MRWATNPYSASPSARAAGCKPLSRFTIRVYVAAGAVESLRDTPPESSIVETERPGPLVSAVLVVILTATTPVESTERSVAPDTA